MFKLDVIRIHLVQLRERLRQMRADQRGYSIEAVVVTALFITRAVVAAGIIAAKVLSTANSIQTK